MHCRWTLPIVVALSLASNSWAQTDNKPDDSDRKPGTPLTELPIPLMWGDRDEGWCLGGEFLLVKKPAEPQLPTPQCFADMISRALKSSTTDVLHRWDSSELVAKQLEETILRDFADAWNAQGMRASYQPGARFLHSGFWWPTGSAEISRALFGDPGTFTVREMETTFTTDLDLSVGPIPEPEIDRDYEPSFKVTHPSKHEILYSAFFRAIFGNYGRPRLPDTAARTFWVLTLAVPFSAVDVAEHWAKPADSPDSNGRANTESSVFSFYNWKLP